MSVALIPIAALLIAFITASPSEKNSEPHYQTPLRFSTSEIQDAVNKKEESRRILLSLQEKSPEELIEQENRNPLDPHNISQTDNNADAEYQTILSFISTKFKKVSEDDAHEIARSLVEYGKEHDMDPKLAAAVIARESAFNKEAVSSTGAKGLGQIKDFNFATLNITNPFDIGQNVGGTTQYLKKMMSKWESRMGGAEKDTIKKEPTAFQAKVNDNFLIVPQSENEKIKLALASYYKGFTNVNRSGVDSKTESYVKDIMKNYNDLQSIKNEKRFQRP